ncbi:hypothetical protein FF125_09655 [Aureibaculum algae]|uniref:Smr domain-containing protein n=2 Tax=Aureibaculum TaxID=2706948 RepID=A0A5B7TPJ8_9FLAO|nr:MULTISPECIES: Smr/MutS family protein [Aureibaculum]MBJ2174696.1 Smr/MutS family protein [Aureibaculum flavum]QCX38685.1 hypothetical protein FF125_09655 [Aureibaculum algae]
MKKLFFRKPPLDLHGVTYSDVQELVEDYVLLNQSFLPLQIITGNSQGMKNRVTRCLKEHGFTYQIGDAYNKGYIAVLK